MSLLWVMASGDPYYHASTHEFQPGDEVVPSSAQGVHHDHPLQEAWRDDRVWMAKDPGNAAAWEGHDRPQHVYEVRPHKDVTEHEDLTDYDLSESADHMYDQHHASGATVVRRLHPSEWNDFCRNT